MKQTLTTLTHSTPSPSSTTTAATTTTTLRLSNSYSPSSTSSLLSSSQPNSSSNNAQIKRPTQSLLSPSLKEEQLLQHHHYQQQQQQQREQQQATPPTIVTPSINTNSYRNIKTRYFSSLNLNSPIKEKVKEESSNLLEQSNNSSSSLSATESTKSTAIPIPTTKTTPIPINRHNGLVSRSTGGGDDIPSSINLKPNRKYGRHGHTISETPFDQTFAESSFLFGSMDGMSLKASRHGIPNAGFKSKGQLLDEEDYEGSSVVSGKRSFQPPHLLTNRSNFSLYRHEKKVLTRKKLKDVL